MNPPAPKFAMDQEVAILVQRHGPDRDRQRGFIVSGIYLEVGPGIPRGGWFYRISYRLARGKKMSLYRFEDDIASI